jgi:glycosyltransferase involved in cell wall biosynthesis
MIWFDVTDLVDYSRPHLTGIQRTLVSTLAELMTIRDEVRLFAYDQHLGRLREVEGVSLPASIQRHLAITVEPHAAPQLRRDSRVGVARPRRSIVRSLSSRFEGRMELIANRVEDREAKQAVREILQGSKTLSRAIARRVFRSRRKQARKLAAIAQRAPGDGVIFAPNDVCISMSPSWGNPEYADEIARNKLGGEVKCVNMIYDLIPTLFPEWLPGGWSEIFDPWARRQIANADVVLTISEYQKVEIANYMRTRGLPSKRIEVMIMGDNPPLLANEPAAEIALPRYVPRRKFVLFVATVDVRKNHLCTYHVWRRLSSSLGEDCPELVLIGVNGHFVEDLFHQIRNDGLVKNLISHLQGVTDEELAWYYANCLFTIYPSLYEGWGLPVAESLAVGRYCVASNSSSLPEAGREFPDYFDPLDFAECYRLVHRAVTNPQYVQAREQRIRAEYKPRTWRMAAQQVSDLVDTLVVRDGTSSPLSVAPKPASALPRAS